MANASRSSASGNILHFNAARLRVTGSGSLKLRLFSYDDVRSIDLTPISMSGANAREVTILTNFTEEAAQLEFRTDGTDDSFTISKITIFVKPVMTGSAQ